jgi:hypothetical protein
MAISRQTSWVSEGWDTSHFIGILQLALWISIVVSNLTISNLNKQIVGD